MNAEQKAIIALAEKEGLSPCEKDARLVVHDMVNATRKAMQKFEVGYNKMTEKQQDAVLGDLEEAYKALALTVARTIASGGTPAISMTLKDMKISNGTVTGIVDGSDKHFNDLISKVQDKSEVLVVLFEREYADAMDNIQADKDQRSLPLDSADKPEKKTRASAGTGSATSAGALAKKAIELPPKLIEDARAFIIKNQVAKVSSLQNFLKINMAKAEALQKLFEEEGLIKFVGTDASGEYEMVRGTPAKFDAATLEVMYSTACREVIKAVSTDDSVLRQIYGDDDNLIEQALMRMEEDGIVSAPSPEGLRDVLTLPQA